MTIPRHEIWKRECQSCGQSAVYNRPNIKSDKDLDKYLLIKCRFCKSESLDYGKDYETNPLVRDYDNYCKELSYDEEGNCTNTPFPSWEEFLKLKNLKS